MLAETRGRFSVLAQYCETASGGYFQWWFLSPAIFARHCRHKYDVMLHGRGPLKVERRTHLGMARGRKRQRPVLEYIMLWSMNTPQGDQLSIVVEWVWKRPGVGYGS